MQAVCCTKTGESLLWFSLARPESLAGPLNSGSTVYLIGFNLDTGQNCSLWSEFYRLLYWFRCMKATEIKLRKHCYDDNSMGFQAAGFLYAALLCSICFKCTLLQVIRSGFSIHKPHTHTCTHTQSNACTLRRSDAESSQGHRSPHSLKLPSFSEKENIESMLYETRERRQDFLIFTLVSQMCFWEREQSGAGQVISLSQWESTPWNSPREARKAAHNIPPLPLSQLSLFYILQLKAFLKNMPTALMLFHPIWMLIFFPPASPSLWSLFIHIFTVLHLKANI